MTTELVKASASSVVAETALAFCKECLGWKNAYHFTDWGYAYICESVSKELADTELSGQRHFHYMHLDKVMEKVEEWCGRNGHSFLLDAAADGIGSEPRFMLDERFSRCKIGTDDPRRCIMSACLEAHRVRRKTIGLADTLRQLNRAQLRAFEGIAGNLDRHVSRKTAAVLLEQGLIEEYEEALPGWPPAPLKRYRVPRQVHMEWRRMASEKFDSVANAPKAGD